MPWTLPSPGQNKKRAILKMKFYVKNKILHYEIYLAMPFLKFVNFLIPNCTKWFPSNCVQNAQWLVPIISRGTDAQIIKNKNCDFSLKTCWESGPL